MKEINLFENKINCCGCGACASICPKKAIKMKTDEYGFLFPEIDENQCVKCGICKSVCAYQEGMVKNEPLQVYAAVNKNKEQLLNSASGGVFSAIATQVLKNGGVVFGASLEFKNGHAIPHHIFIEDENEISKIQGSKYVQSSIDDTYIKSKQFLEEGRKVLFSGTPCQVAGLYGFLKRKYDNLITIDLICHGVPNAKFFDDYIQTETKKRNCNEIIGYSFRNKKKKGWGMNSCIEVKDFNNKIRKIYVPARLTSYFTLFLDGEIYRENCYECIYATKERISDLTIGDYWGIEKEHPELLGKNGYDEKKGISCILVNTKKGMDLCKKSLNLLDINESTFAKVSKRNGQLSSPSKKTDNRENILNNYSKYGYAEIEKWFKNKYRGKIIKHTIYNKIPRKLRMLLRQIMKG